MSILESPDKLLVKELRDKLVKLGNSENAFVSVECVFYDALTIARNYGNDVSENKILEQLKSLQATEYTDTKKHFNKASQREKAISHFTHRLKGILSVWLKEAVPGAKHTTSELI